VHSTKAMWRMKNLYRSSWRDLLAVNHKYIQSTLCTRTKKNNYQFLIKISILSDKFLSRNIIIKYCITFFINFLYIFFIDIRLSQQYIGTFLSLRLIIIRSSVNSVPLKYQILSRLRNRLSAKSDGDSYAVRSKFHVYFTACRHDVGPARDICIAKSKTIVPLSTRYR